MSPSACLSAGSAPESDSGQEARRTATRVENSGSDNGEHVDVDGTQNGGRRWLESAREELAGDGGDLE